jgi:hypothetical protein
MAKSKKRGGEKQHRKRLEERNKKIKKDYEAAVKQAWDKFEQWKNQNGSSDDKGISTTAQ